MGRAITHLTWLRFNRRSLEMRLLWYPGEFLTISAKKTFATVSALSGGLECDGSAIAFGAKQTCTAATAESRPALMTHLRHQRAIFAAVHSGVLPQQRGNVGGP